MRNTKIYQLNLLTNFCWCLATNTSSLVLVCNYFHVITLEKSKAKVKDPRPRFLSKDNQNAFSPRGQPELYGAVVFRWSNRHQHVPENSSRRLSGNSSLQIKGLHFLRLEVIFFSTKNAWKNSDFSRWRLGFAVQQAGLLKIISTTIPTVA